MNAICCFFFLEIHYNSINIMFFRYHLLYNPPQVAEVKDRLSMVLTPLLIFLFTWEKGQIFQIFCHVKNTLAKIEEHFRVYLQKRLRRLKCVRHYKNNNNLIETNWWIEQEVFGVENHLLVHYPKCSALKFATLTKTSLLMIFIFMFVFVSSTQTTKRAKCWKGIQTIKSMLRIF